MKGNWVISKGHNESKSHTRQYNFNVRAGRVDCHHNIHAEISALVNSKDNDLGGADVFVSRTLRSGTSGMCRPCAACALALKEAGIRLVWYTTEKGIECLDFRG